MTEYETTVLDTLDKILEQATISATWITVISALLTMTIILSFIFMKR